MRNCFKNLSKLYLLFGLLLFKHLAFAFGASALPDEIKTNTDKVEAGIAWGLKIGGVGAIIYGCLSFARNKLQGQAVDTIVYIVVGFGAAAAGLGWWMGKSAEATSGFAFF